MKKDFPFFKKHPHLIYFDSAATSQKPQEVIDAIQNFYIEHNAPIFRSIYPLAEQATQLYENARAKIADFIQAKSDEIVFTANATAGINFIADTWGRKNIKHGDEIVLTELEHHANVLPWQRLAQEKKAVLKFIPVDQQGVLQLDALDKIITSKTKLVSFLDASNALGMYVPVQTIVQRARKVGATVLIDACQSVPHKRISIKDYKPDFLVFSGHKMCGPTGIGVLYIKKDLQDQIPPYQVGGGMVHEADYHHVEYLKAPKLFEAGTPAIAQAIALAQACVFLQTYMQNDALIKHSTHLVSTLIDGLSTIKNIRILGSPDLLKQQSSLLSFVHEKHHAHDIGAYLALKNICVRTGHYCAQPLAKKLGIRASVRASFYLYNTVDEVEALIFALKNL